MDCPGQAPGQASPFSGKNSRSEFVCFLVQVLWYESNFPRSASLLVMLALAFATVSQSGCLGPLRAAILETLCKSGPPRGRGSASPWNTLQKRASARPRGRQSLKHYAKAGLRGATGAPVLRTLCKSRPPRGRGGRGRVLADCLEDSNLLLEILRPAVLPGIFCKKRPGRHFG